ncbi:MAG: DUF1614 domain-containing protein [Clostridiales bacterium]|jgi:hypothetical protein|nr:DUF1614 domain-containing protein [Clostridiales bacterium]
MNFSVGLVLLGILIVLMVFGVFNRLFERMRIGTVWAIVASVVLGAGFIIPSIRINQAFSFNIGGFIIAALLAIYFFLTLGSGNRMVRASAAMLFTAGITILMYMFFPQTATWLRVLFSVGLGILAGGVSSLIVGTGTARGALYSCIAGILAGQAINFAIQTGRQVNPVLDLGGGSCFDAIIISIIMTALIAEIIRMASASRMRGTSRTSFSHEAGEYHNDNFRRTVDGFYTKNTAYTQTEDEYYYRNALPRSDFLSQMDDQTKPPQ